MAIILNVQLPTRIAQGMTIMPGVFDTEVVYGTGGKSFRNARRTRPRRSYRVSFGEWEWTEDEIQRTIDIMLLCRGRLYGFLLRDPFDNEGVDEPLTVVEGSTVDYQLSRRHTDGAYSIDRKITRPVTGSVSIEVGGTPTPSGWTLETGGIIRFAAPPGGAVTASFDFLVPVTFKADNPSVTINGPTAQVPGFELEEELE